MRSNIERVASAKRRAEKFEHRRKARLAHIAAFGSTAAGLIFIIALAVFMPSLNGSAAIAGVAGTGSIFASGKTGYIVIGVLAFALGVAVTLLCIKLRAYWNSEDGNGRDNR